MLQPDNPIPTHDLVAPDFFGRPNLEGTGLSLRVPASVPSIRELGVISSLLKSFGSGGSFIDVGAHAGFYSILLSGMFSDVWAFEPSKMQRNLLEYNVKNNDLENVTVFDAALGGSSEARQLFVMGNSGGSNTLLPPQPGTPPMEEYSVDVRTLDSYSPKEVRLVKIDVEGWELEVLRGATDVLAHWKPALLIESHEDSASHDELVSFITNQKYSWSRPFSDCPELVWSKPLESSS